jgi:DNA-binding Lrp family transcriptional regulator
LVKVRSLQSVRPEVAGAVTANPLDDVDQRIVELLNADARMSARAVAREIEMSPGAVSERISRLEGAGVIRGYHAEIDPAALGLRLQVIVGLQISQEPSLAAIVDALLTIPEVASVHVVSGQWDLVVIVHVRDGDHLRELVLEKIWRIPGFRHSETMLILGSYENRGSPVGAGLVET